MRVSPLLSTENVGRISTMFSNNMSEDIILDELKAFSIEEGVHILRFLHNKPEISETYTDRLYRVWRSIVPSHHDLDTPEHRKALYEIQRWWDVFALSEGMTSQRYDELEKVLDTLGATPEGKMYFRWVALSPVDSTHETLWDEDRRGAILCLGKYAYHHETEQFLARHLDDWHMIQVEVIHIFVAMRSRLFAKLAPWYMDNDIWLQPYLKEYF